MPTSLLKSAEWDELLQKAEYSDLQKQMITSKEKEEFIKLNPKEKMKILPFIDEKSRGVLSMREIVSIRQKQPYQR
jgi:hypothetical protein